MEPGGGCHRSRIPVVNHIHAVDNSNVMSTAPATIRPQSDDDVEERRFVVGTTGWTEDDLDDPAFEAQWEAGAYEIVDGVLTQMPAARLDDGAALFNLMVLVRAHMDATGDRGKLSVETDVILQKMRVPRVDAVYVSGDLLEAQAAANAASPKPRGRYGRVRVVPTMIIENISPGHEAHDRVTKRQWYAERGVPHYWLLDAYGKSLETLVLDGKVYRIEQLGRECDEVRPSLFPGLAIPLSKVWS
jgi:Uma2 family endonuclease